MDDAIEKGPKEHVGEESPEEARRKEGGPAAEELVPGDERAANKHEPERDGCEEVEEEPPETGQSEDTRGASGERSQRSAAVLEHGSVVSHRGLAVCHSLARFFLLRTHLPPVIRHG